MVTTRHRTYADSNSNAGDASSQATVTAPAQTSQDTTTQVVTNQDGPDQRKRRRKNRPRKELEYYRTADFAAEIRKKHSYLHPQRCDRCKIIGRRCDQDPNGCEACKGLNIKCTVTNLRSHTTWIKGDPVPGHVQVENQELMNHIKNLSNQINELKSQLKYDTEAQALRDLRQQNERLRAENERYRSMSMSTVADLDTRPFLTEEDRMLMANPMSKDAPFSNQRLDIGQNPYAPPLRADNDPATLPTWAQPAMSMPGMNAFSGPLTPATSATVGLAHILQGTTTQHSGYPDPKIDPALPDPTVGMEGQEYCSQAFPDYRYGDKQASNNAGNVTNFDNFDISDRPAHQTPNEDDNIIDDDALFDVIMWDQ